MNRIDRRRLDFATPPSNHGKIAGMKYVALLRGINVGGNNLIKMAALKACLEAHGFDEVSTYIQSGNVVFAALASERGKLVHRLEKLLSEAFEYESTLVLRTNQQMTDIVHQAPRGFGADPSKYRYDVIFLKEPLTAKVAMKSVLTHPGVDEVHEGGGVLYFSRLISKATQSKLGKIASSPIYGSVTIRNWNTTTKLLTMMEETL